MLHFEIVSESSPPWSVFYAISEQNARTSQAGSIEWTNLPYIFPYSFTTYVYVLLFIAVHRYTRK